MEKILWHSYCGPGENTKRGSACENTYYGKNYRLWYLWNDHQKHSHLSNLTPSSCLWMCAHVCVCMACLDCVLIFCFVMGHVLQTGETAHKKSIVLSSNQFNNTLFTPHGAIPLDGLKTTKTWNNDNKNRWKLWTKHTGNPSIFFMKKKQTHCYFEAGWLKSCRTGNFSAFNTRDPNT